jgi:hypothetical protein
MTTLDVGIAALRSSLAADRYRARQEAAAAHRR